MITVINNPTSSKIINKGPGVTVNFFEELTETFISSSSVFVTASGHTYVSGTASGHGKQMIVHCDVPFYISDGESNILSSNIIETTQSYTNVYVNTNFGQYKLQFPFIEPVDHFVYIYNNTSSLKVRTTNELSAYYNGSSSSLGNAANLINANYNTWTRGLDFRGVGRGFPSFRYVTLITSKHGISCAHSPPSVGETITFYDSASNVIFTNVISSSSNLAGTDVLLLAFSSSCPPECAPYWIFPRNFPDYVFDATVSPYGPALPCIVFDSNRHVFMCRALSDLSASNSMGHEMAAFGLMPNCLFTTTEVLTGGASGTPVFTLVGGKLTFMWSLHGGNASGPLVSSPVIFDWLSSSVAPLSLQVLDMTGYQSTF